MSKPCSLMSALAVSMQRPCSESFRQHEISGPRTAFCARAEAMLGLLLLANTCVHLSAHPMQACAINRLHSLKVADCAHAEAVRWLLLPANMPLFTAGLNMTNLTSVQADTGAAVGYAMTYAWQMTVGANCLHDCRSLHSHCSAELENAEEPCTKMSSSVSCYAISCLLRAACSAMTQLRQCML